MTKWLFRFEASDFDNAVFDLQQLSAIRGASLTFLYSEKLVLKVLREVLNLPELQPVYGGASEGVYAFEADKKTATKASEGVQSALAQYDKATGCHQHMSYVTALVECKTEQDLKTALYDVMAICSAKSNQKRLTLPVFDRAASLPGSRRDPRPAQVGGDQSQAVEDRMAFGREQKTQFYTRFTKQSGSAESLPFGFSADFEHVVKAGNLLRLDGSIRENGDETHGNGLPLSLHGKMAVFYADGNKFGSKRSAAIESDPSLGTLRKFSSDLLANQKKLLANIINWFGAHYGKDRHDAFFLGNDARFETLLWGGDELLFVMPSWLAFEFSQKFFEWIKDWRVNDAPVSFSAGVVICGHKTPIRDAKTMTNALVDSCKELEVDENLLQIEIFESLSMPGYDIEGFRGRLYNHSGFSVSGDEIKDRLSIRADDLPNLLSRIMRLKAEDGYPRSQLYRLLEASVPTDGVPGDKKVEEEKRAAIPQALQKVFKTYMQRAGEGRELAFRDLYVLRPDDPRPALLALEIGVIAHLWDYVCPFEVADYGEAAE
nr:hypothetical protein [uncultured Cohaesibacter sp.]